MREDIPGHFMVAAALDTFIHLCGVRSNDGIENPLLLVSAEEKDCLLNDIYSELSEEEKADLLRALSSMLTRASKNKANEVKVDGLSTH
jgi:hypothetical protein